MAFPLVSFAAPSAQQLPRTANGAIVQADAVLASGNEILVYYREGSDVIVSRCAADPQAKLTGEQELAVCKAMGVKNRVPLEHFKRALRASLILPPVNPSTPPAAATARSNFDLEIAGIDRALEQKAETDAGGAFKKIQADLAALKKRVNAGETGASMAKQLDALVDKIIEAEIAPDKFIAVNPDNQPAVYSILQNFDASRAECGTDALLKAPRAPGPGAIAPNIRGANLEKTFFHDLFFATAFAETNPDPIARRIQDCAQIKGHAISTKPGIVWNLVTRERDPKTGRFYETWQDSQTKLVWGQRLENTYTHDNLSQDESHRFAVRIDETGKITEETACNSPEGKLANTHIAEKKFGLPSMEEAKQALEDGMVQVMSDKSATYWSNAIDNTHKSISLANAYGVNFTGLPFSKIQPYEVEESQYPRNAANSVQCVGR